MDPISIAAASLGLISVAKDLADIARSVVKFSNNVTHARAKLERYCREVRALEALPDILTNDPMVQYSLGLLENETTTIRGLVDDLQTGGFGSKIKFAFKNQDLKRLLEVIERAKTSLLLVSNLRHIAFMEQQSQRLLLQYHTIEAAQMHHTRSLDQQTQMIQSQHHAIHSIEQRLVPKTISTPAPTEDTTTRSWLQTILCALSFQTVTHLTPIARFVNTGHDEDSAVVQTIINGTKYEIVRLLKSGELHPAHCVYRCGRYIPLYLMTAVWRDTDICQTMLNHCDIDYTLSYELIAEMATYHRCAQDFSLSHLFEQFVTHTDIDLTTDLLDTHWLGEITDLDWHAFVYQRLLESRGFRSVEHLMLMDPVEVTHCNTLRLMTAHGLSLSTYEDLGQQQKDWLMHAVLAARSSRHSPLRRVGWLIHYGADPYSVVHGRTALATIFVATDLDSHLSLEGRDRSIFAAWQQLLESFGIAFRDYIDKLYEVVDQEHVRRECCNHLRGHELRLLAIRHDNLDISVTWSWPMFSKQHMPGTYPDNKINKVCWRFWDRDGSWLEQRKELKEYGTTFDQLLDDLGFQHSLPAQDDHDWIARSLFAPRDCPQEETGLEPRGRSLDQRLTRRTHSQPRHLKGLTWIPHRRHSWLNDYYICPFTSTLHHRVSPWRHRHNFTFELGRCLGLHDNRELITQKISCTMPASRKSAQSHAEYNPIHSRLLGRVRLNTVGQRLVSGWLLEFETEAQWRKTHDRSEW